MDDEELELANFCSDLVSLQSLEAFPRNLLGRRASGEWVVADELCRDSGLPVSSPHPHLFAAWLPDPSVNEAYVVILFYDDESKWSLTAHYHRQRLKIANGLDQALQQVANGAGRPDGVRAVK